MDSLDLCVTDHDKPLEIVVVVPGDPHGKMSVKAASRGGVAVTYRDPKDRKRGARIGNCMLGRVFEVGMTVPFFPPGTPLKVDIFCLFRCPKSAHRKTTEVPRIHHIIKPDYDNVAKLVGDAGEGVWWANDKEICMGTVTKARAAQGEEPRMVVWAKEALPPWPGEIPEK